MVTAFLGLGANLGDRQKAFQGARAALHRLPDLRVSAASGLYETEPVGGPPDQPIFLNAALQVETQLPPRDLLQACHAVETLFGRQRRRTWGPRTLDIDILFYGSEAVREEELVIPHPQLHLRPFVLAPLLDLAPDLPHPLLGQTISQLHARFPGSPGVRRLAAEW